MYVACSTLCFADLPLSEALQRIRELNFAKADLIVSDHGPHLKPSELLADKGLIVAKLKAANLPIAAIHAEFSEADGPVTRQQLRAVCRLARQLAVPVVSTVGGRELELETARLRDWVRIANAEGVILTLETNSHTITSDPVQAAELCRRVPGLGITLDPSHYVAHPQGPVDYDVLYPFVRHVRLRDSGRSPEAFQVSVGQGDIEYSRIINQLDRCRYDRALTVDVRQMPGTDFPVELEVRKLKYLLESLV